jgi:hypothetical protein
MANAADLRRLALALPGTTEAAHFERAAFKVARIYVTLSGDGQTANLKLTPDEQELKCMVAEDIFKPLDNAWGQQGWTTIYLPAATEAELSDVLDMAWRHAEPKVIVRKRAR